MGWSTVPGLKNEQRSSRTVYPLTMMARYMIGGKQIRFTTGHNPCRKASSDCFSWLICLLHHHNICFRPHCITLGGLRPHFQELPSSKQISCPFETHRKRTNIAPKTWSVTMIITWRHVFDYSPSHHHIIINVKIIVNELVTSYYPLTISIHPG